MMYFFMHSLNSEALQSHSIVLRCHGFHDAPSKLHDIVRHEEDNQEAAVAAPGRLTYA